MHDNPRTYLPTPAVRARYGVTKQSLWRWLQNDVLGFPKPRRINNRLYWNVTELETWEASREEGGANAPRAA